MIKRHARNAMLVSLLVILSGVAAAAPPRPSDLEAAQVEADAAFEARRYAEAYGIYFEDLVPTGDKYAQYMIGAMYLQGLGVTGDVPLGAAWLALAAERGDARLVAERDAIVAELNEDQREMQQALFDQLSARFSDCALVVRAVAEDRKRVTASTGSRLASNNTGPVTVLFDQDERDGNLSQGELREQIRKRERYLRESCGPPANNSAKGESPDGRRR